MSEYTSVLTRKGQATVPVEIRQTLGLRRGDKIAWVQRNGHVEVERARSVTERTAGIARRYALTPAPTLEEIDALVEQAIAEDALELGDGE
ncbi:MAG TPA: AbrB/MazE/SpoVT family DNA-binding domain-containing protein [Thermomicrobiales bacterium]